jgi:hypothetical protein
LKTGFLPESAWFLPSKVQGSGRLAAHYIFQSCIEVPDKQGIRESGIRMSSGCIKRPSPIKRLIPGHGMVIAIGATSVGFFINF